MVQGEAISKDMMVVFEKKTLKASPYVTLNFPVSRKLNLHFTAMYNYQVLSHENLLFCTTNNLYWNELTKYKFASEKKYLFDSHGGSMKNLMGLAPFSFKLEMAFTLGLDQKYKVAPHRSNR